MMIEVQYEGVSMTGGGSEWAWDQNLGVKIRRD